VLCPKASVKNHDWDAFSVIEPYASGEGRLDDEVLLVKIPSECDTMMVSTKRMMDTIVDDGFGSGWGFDCER
jgi:hypothetical protein